MSTHASSTPSSETGSPASVPLSTSSAPAVSQSTSASANQAAPLSLPGSSPRSGGLWLGMVALLLSVGALVAAAMLWQRVGFTQQEMARRSQESAVQSLEARNVASQAEALTHELQARLAVAEVKLSEVSLQRSQLEELMLSLSRSRDDNLVQDIDSALRLAMQQTQLTGSAQPLLSALQAADQRISRAAQPRLNPVQRAIARDVERIQGMSLTDVPALVRRLDELAQAVESWPVHNEWRGEKALNPAGDPLSKSAHVIGAAKAGAAKPPEVLPRHQAANQAANANANAASGWPVVAQTWNGFWKKVWASVTQNGRELVRVSRIDSPDAALLAPEQVFFLRENLKLRLLNARLELLSRQMESAQGDLLATEKALARYFDRSTPVVESALDALASLRAEVSKSELPRPDESLAALATAAGGR